MKILLDINAKVSRKDISKPRIGYENLRELGNENGVGIINSATSTNLLVKSTLLPHHNIYKHILIFADGRTHNQTDILGI
jgi:hypothetical protein